MMVSGSPPSQSPAASMVVSPPTEPDDSEANLHAFREAIALSSKYLFKKNVNIYRHTKNMY